MTPRELDYLNVFGAESLQRDDDKPGCGPEAVLAIVAIALFMALATLGLWWAFEVMK